MYVLSKFSADAYCRETVKASAAGKNVEVSWIENAGLIALRGGRHSRNSRFERSNASLCASTIRRA
jgi:hypothetical protein